MDPALLEILCCPETHQPLRVATAEEMRACDPELREALIRADGRVLYPVENGIPLLVPDAARSVGD